MDHIGGGGRAGSSAVNYALLDAELNPLTPFRLLELRSPRTRQRRSGPEDARLVRVGGRRRSVTVPLWNATMANLTLMALGSSAPLICNL